MKDSTDNTSKPKRNHLDQTVPSLVADSEMDDQDAIDKLLVDTGFETDQENNPIDEFSDFDDFGEFVDPAQEALSIEEEPVVDIDEVDIDEVDIDSTDEDAIDKLLADSGFETANLSTEDEDLEADLLGLDDFSDFVEPIIDDMPAISEELEPVVDIAPSDEDAIDKLLVDSGFDNEAALSTENDKLDDDIFGLDDFSDFVEPVLEGALIAEEEPVIDVDEINADNSDGDAIDKLLADSGFDNAAALSTEDDKLEDDFFGLNDFSDSDEPVLEEPLIAEEEQVVAVDEVNTDSSDEDSFDKLLADSGFDNTATLSKEDDTLADDFIGLDESELEAATIEGQSVVDPIIDNDEINTDNSDEETIGKLLADSGFDNDSVLQNGYQVDEFADDEDDFAESVSINDSIPELEMPMVEDDADHQNAIDDLLSDSAFDVNNDQLDSAIVDEIADFPPMDGYGEAELTEANEVESMATPTEPFPESDEDAIIAAQLAMMGKTGDEFLALDEIGDDVFAESGTEEASMAEGFTEPDSGRNVEREDDFLLADFDITAGTDFPGLDDAAENLNELSDSSSPEPIIPDDSLLASEPVIDIQTEPLLEMATAVVAESAESEALAQLKSEQERMDKQYKKQLIEAEAKAKKAAIFGYVALTIGIIALALAGVMGWLAFSGKSELTKLSESVAVDSHAIQKTDLDLTVVKASVDQLNQKVDGVVEQLKGTPIPSQQSPDVAALPAGEPAGKGHEDVAAKKDIINKSLDVSATHVADLHAPKTQEPSPHSGAADHAVNKPVENTVKPEATHKAPDVVPPSSEPLADKKVVPSKGVSSKNTAVKKKPAKIIKPQAEQRQSTNAHWSVNLIAYKQDWYAKSKAAEFAQKGVPVEVVPVDVNGVAWYRLRVSGFNNRGEAYSYAARVKKALNLSSVWVGDI